MAQAKVRLYHCSEDVNDDECDDETDDVDDCDDISEHCNISKMPTFQFYKNNELIDEFSGVDKKKLLKTTTYQLTDLGFFYSMNHNTVGTSNVSFTVSPVRRSQDVPIEGLKA